jgi:GNAT superfamily N-acetyltransferase
MSNIEINTDKTQLDVPFIHAFITDSYWAKGRTIETVQTCIDNSLNFGVYLNEKQIGYARVVTDYAQFAYLLDVFINESYRGKGYSKELMKYILSCDELNAISVMRLATSDAHGLYEQFGFTPLAKPENLMERISTGD